MTRTLGTSRGKYSLSHIAFVSGCVQLSTGSPFSPWIATMLLISVPSHRIKDRKQPYSALKSPLAPLSAGCTIFKPIVNLNWPANLTSDESYNSFEFLFVFFPQQQVYMNISNLSSDAASIKIVGNFKKFQKEKAASSFRAKIGMNPLFHTPTIMLTIGVGLSLTNHEVPFLLFPRCKRFRRI